MYPPHRPQPMQHDMVSGEQYRYALTNFRIAHEKVESQRQQLEEQERQVAALKARIALLEGGDAEVARKQVNSNQGQSSVDDFSIRTAASKLERLINRWAADVVRNPPAPLTHIRDAALMDLEGPQPEAAEATAVIVQNLLRHAMSETICEGIVNVMVVTNSNEANEQLTRIHEHIFTRDPTVASVWRRQTFSAAVEKCSPEMSLFILGEHIPSLSQILIPDGVLPPPISGILDSAYDFSRMLHGSRSSSGGSTDAFYRAYVPELGSVLYPRQIELVKRCLKSECGEVDRVGSCIFFGLVKMTRAPPSAQPNPDEPAGLAQTVVRRAQVICECALGIVGSTGGANMAGADVDGFQQGGYGPSPPASYAESPPPPAGSYASSVSTGPMENRGYGTPPPHAYPTPPPPQHGYQQPPNQRPTGLRLSMPP